MKTLFNRRFSRAVALLLAANLLALAALGWLANQLTRETDEISRLETALDESLNKKTNLALLQQIVKSTEAERQTLARQFAGGKLPALIEDVEALGEASGLDLSLTGASDPTDGASAALTLTSEGDFGQVFHFLALLERQPLKFKIQRVELTSRQTAESAARQWRLSLNLSIVNAAI